MQPVHATASAVVISDDGSRVLLHRHRRSGRWIQPGGHVHPGEDSFEAARREAEEETGLPGLSHFGGAPRRVGASVHQAPVHPDDTPHLHDDTVWLLVAPPGARPCPPPHESPDCRLLPWEEALALAADEPLRDALRAARRIAGDSDGHRAGGGDDH